MMSEKIKDYYDLTSANNDITSLTIRPKDSFSCNIFDNDGVPYKGFVLAHTEKGNAHTLCDITLQKSSTDRKYQARLIFRKIDSELCDKEVQKSKNYQRISFQNGQDGYRELWKMINFLQKWRETIDVGEFSDYFTLTKSNISNTLSQISKLQNRDTILKGLESLSKTDLDNIGNLVNITKVVNLLKKWKANVNQKEQFWQELFAQNTWILSQIFACPFVYVQEQMYCGGARSGKGLGSVTADFGLQNSVTKSIAIIEIKTPQTGIVCKTKCEGCDEKEILQDNTIYAPHTDLTSAVIQVLNQKRTFEKEELKLYELNKSQTIPCIKCVVIAGTVSELSEGQKKSFELYRNSLRDVEIITYDELYQRIEGILEILQ